MEPVRDSGELSSTALATRIRSAQVAMLFKRLNIAALAGVFFGAMLALTSAPYIGRAAAEGWFAACCASTAFRIFGSWAYSSAKDREPERWLRVFTFGLAGDGLVWGLLGLWPLANAELHQSAIILPSLVGVAAVGVLILQANWRCMAGFLSVLLLPAAAVQFATGTDFGRFTGAGVLVFGLVMAFEGRRAERQIVELLRLRFDTARIAGERAEALRLLRAESLAKDQFLATMSHEMRTPLNGILGLTRMLQDNGPGSPPQREHLVLMERTGEHLLTLINDILDYSKLAAGQVRINRRVFELNDAIAEVLAFSAPTAAAAGLQLTASALPAGPCWVSGDPSRLRQVLHNLVGNAIKFTEAGRVWVTAQYDPATASATIEVHDTGIGIGSAELGRIFNAFHQSDNSDARRYPGTGLGLTISRELARAMGGDLVCRSAPGAGSTFAATFRLPAADALQPAPLPAAAPAPALRLHGRVLLAEDNPVNALVAETALRKLGLEVDLVIDGLAAVDAFRTHHHDLVLMDCQMPGMDGFEATRQIRGYERASGRMPVGIIALTANALPGDVERSLAAGMSDHLAKPFREADLRRLLEKYLATEQPQPIGAA